jgi:hypothetical protein
MRFPLGVCEADWQGMSQLMRGVYEDASRVLDDLESKRRSTARRIVRKTCLEGSSVLAALLLLKQLELVHVHAQGDDLVVVLRALPVRCERVTDDLGNVRWLCISKAIERAD